MTWSRISHGWVLQRHAELIRWAADDSAVALWGQRVHDDRHDEWNLEGGALVFGPVGAALQRVGIDGSLDDAAWLTSDTIAVARRGRARNALEVLRLPGGSVRARREVQLDYARLAATPDGERVVFMNRQFPASEGHEVTVLDGATLSKLEQWPSAAPGKSGRAWIDPSGTRHVLLVEDRDAGSASLSIDGSRELPLALGGSAYVEWLSDHVFVVREYRFPAGHTNVFDIDEQAPLFAAEHHASNEHRVDIDPAGERLVVLADGAPSIIDRSTGAVRQLAPTFGSADAARWIDSSRIAFAVRRSEREARVVVWDLERDIVATPISVELHGSVSGIASPIALERTPSGSYVCLYWWAHEGRSFAAFSSHEL